MAKRFLPTPATFADGNYPAGANAWNAQPRAVALTGSEKASGFTPKTPRAPEIDNGLWREYHDAATVQAYAAMRDWRVKVAVPPDGSILVTAGGPIPPNMVGSEQWFLTTGSNFYDIHDYLVEGPKYNAKNKTNADALTPLQIVGVNAGSYLVRVAGSSHLYYGNLSSATLNNDTAFVGSGLTVNLLGYAGDFAIGSAVGNALAVLGTGVQHSSTMGGGSWSASTFPATIASAYEFVQKPGGSVVVLSCKVGTTPQLFCSTDLGVTWTHAQTFTASAQPGSLCYDERRALFLYLEDATGLIYASSDGVTWLSVASGAPRSVASGGSVALNALQQATAGTHMMAAAGPCLARVMQRSDGVNIVIGIAYTFDLENWNFTGLTTTQFDSIIDLYSVDGRFVAVLTGAVAEPGASAGQSSLMLSGTLEAPAADFA